MVGPLLCACRQCLTFPTHSQGRLGPKDPSSKCDAPPARGVAAGTWPLATPSRSLGLLALPGWPLSASSLYLRPCLAIASYTSFCSHPRKFLSVTPPILQMSKLSHSVILELQPPSSRCNTQSQVTSAIRTEHCVALTKGSCWNESQVVPCRELGSS